MQTAKHATAYTRKSLLKRRSIKVHKSRLNGSELDKSEQQTKAFQEGKGMSFYIKEVAKVLIHPSQESNNPSKRG